MLIVPRGTREQRDLNAPYVKLRLGADKRQRTRSCTHPTSSAPRPERTCTGRAGFVTRGTRNGADGSAIARQAGHASLDSVETYRRDSGTVVGDFVATWMSWECSAW